MTPTLAALGQANYATPYTIATLAGGQNGYANGTGSAAQFSSPWGAAVGSAGNVCVADFGGGAVRQVTLVGTNWQVSTLAAGFSAPSSVAVDNATNLYVADQGASLIRKLTRVGTNWVVSTIAGPAGF